MHKVHIRTKNPQLKLKKTCGSTARKITKITVLLKNWASIFDEQGKNIQQTLVTKFD